jgi:hypothetical protein
MTTYEELLKKIEVAHERGDETAAVIFRSRLSAIRREQAEAEKNRDPIAARTIRDGVKGLIAEVRKANPNYPLGDLNEALARCEADLAEAEKNAGRR